MDTVSDGLYDFEEIDFLTEGAIDVRNGMVVYRKYGDYVEDYIKSHGVENGLDRYFTADHNGTPSSVVEINLMKAYVVPILSDPTSEDGDGDGLLDGKRYEINGRIIAPKDPNPLRIDGPAGVWKKHIESARGDVPTMVDRWYGESQVNEYKYVTHFVQNNIKILTTQMLKNEMYGIANIANLDKEKTACILDIADWRNYLDLNSSNSGIEGFDSLKSEAVLMTLSGDIGADRREIVLSLAYFGAVAKLLTNDMQCEEEARAFFQYLGTSGFSDYARASLGSRFLNFKADSKGVIHSQHRQWQASGGYNNGYDALFRTFTGNNMDREKFQFAVGDMEYIIWTWRGDYLNLGAGAEIGIYSRPTWLAQDSDKLDQYFVDYDLAMPMQLYLYNYENSSDIQNIHSWAPDEPQWWICSFNPQYLRDDVDVSKQIMIGSMDFSGNEEMYDCFVAEMNKVGNDEKRKYLTYDERNKTIWLCWYSMEDEK